MNCEKSNIKKTLEQRRRAKKRRLKTVRRKKKEGLVDIYDFFPPSLLRSKFRGHLTRGGGGGEGGDGDVANHALGVLG